MDKLKQETGTVARFIVVGIINTLFGCAIMFGLYNLAGCSYWVSTAANYFFGSILSYILNRKFTFRFSGSTWRSLMKFALNIILCYFIAYGVAKPLTLMLLAGSSDQVRDNVAMFTGMVIFTVLNYLGQKLFAFR